MILNFILVALRNVRKHPLYSLINLLGLSIGLACCILILLHVRSELQFDHFHANSDRIFRVNYIQEGPRGLGTYARIMPPTAAALKSEFPEVEAATNFIIFARLTVRPQGSSQAGIIARNWFFTGSETFSIFDFPLLRGDKTRALDEPGNVVLTEETAHRLFGNEDPLGKPLTIDMEDSPEFGKTPFVVTGVMKHIPSNSHMQFDFLISTATMNRFEQLTGYLQDWDTYLASTYVLLRSPEDQERVQSKLATFTDKYLLKEEGYKKALALQPLTDIHFGSAEINAEQNANEGDILYVQLFALIALFIAGIACVNYMNLATARAMKRSKEVGLRKVVGAARSHMVGQFLTEALIHSVFSCLLAIALVEAVLPVFNSLAGSELTITSAGSFQLILGAFALALLVGIIAGMYPALYLSGLTPSLILRGDSKTGKSGSRLRNVLVVFQFVITIVMIVSTLVVIRQLNYVKNMDLGFNQDRLAVIDINSDDVQENFVTIKNEFLKNPSVKSVAVSSRVPGDWKSFRRVTASTDRTSDGEGVRVYFNGVDEDFLGTYEIPLVQGRNFNRALSSDSTAVILNETAARALFTDSPIGKMIQVPSSKFTGQIIGVVRDFHYHSLHDRIEPMMLGFMPSGGRHVIHGIDYFTVRMAGTDIQKTVDDLTAVHARFDPINPIELGFLDQWWDKLYERDARLGKIFEYSAGLAILIACVGLFGLASFMAEQRTKEIGVRKVLGASSSGIVLLLSRKFALLVLTSLVLAAPLAYIAMNMWLEGFAYRISIEVWVFFLAGSIAVLIAVLTVSVQALKAALANPIEALRYE